MKKIEYRKDFKNLYLPPNSPVIIEMPDIRFVMIDGKGNPNNEEFSLATQALYSFSYAVKMSYKNDNVPKGYYDYTVFPLEGVWDLIDKNKPTTNKDNFAYTIMIRQPEFLTDELFKEFLELTKKKNVNKYLDKLRYETISEGLCCQMLHIGSFDNEKESFMLMERYVNENGYARISKKHREIYLSDPRKTTPEKLKTVLRFQINNN